MNNPLLIICGYSLLIIPVSILGGRLPHWLTITHTRMQLTLSFVGGLMLGIAVLHLLPHAIVETGSLDFAARGLLAGLLFMFLLIRLFHFHQHTAAEAGHLPEHAACGHDHSHQHHHEHGGVHGLSWLGIAAGMSVHTIADGVALGSAVLSDSSRSAWLPGLGVLLAVAFHKPLDSLSITLLMRAGGWPKNACQLINVGFSLLCPLGALMAVMGLLQAGDRQAQLAGLLMAFSAGAFLCISLSDLLPEVQFHRHDRVQLSAALLLGIAAAYGVELWQSRQAVVIEPLIRHADQVGQP
jgi:zinc and cadmium transporter